MITFTSTPARARSQSASATSRGDLAAPVDVGEQAQRPLRAPDRVQVAGEDRVAVDQQLDLVAPRDRGAGQRLGGAQEARARGRRAPRRAGRSRGRSRAGGAATRCRSARRAPRPAPRARRSAALTRGDASDDGGRPIDDRGRPHDVLVHAQLLRARARRRGRPAAAGAAPACPARGPTIRSAPGCCRSRFRWQSGQGVTRQSASASSASPRWRPACLSEASLFMVMIGKPQHLYCAGVVDHRAAERLDQLVQVAVARVLAVDPQAVGRAHDVAAVERARRAGRSAAARPSSARRRARSPRPSATGSAC